MRLQVSWLLAGIVIVLTLAVLVIAFPPDRAVRPPPVSCTAASNCNAPDVDLPPYHEGNPLY